MLSKLINKEQQSVALHLIRRRKDQPRRYFDEAAMEELTTSVKEKGIIQPVILRPHKEDPGRYELVAGERRLEAATRARLPGVPAVIREMSDQEAREIGLIENLQREDLNPIEEIDATLALLAPRLKLSVEQVPSHLSALRYHAKTGKDHPDIAVVEEAFTSLGKLSWQSFVTTRIPLLKLYPDVLEKVREGELDYTKALVVGRVKEERKRRFLLELALEGELSLRELQQNAGIANRPAGPFNQTVFVNLGKIRKEYKKNPPSLSDEEQKRLDGLLNEIGELLGRGRK